MTGTIERSQFPASTRSRLWYPPRTRFIYIPMCIETFPSQSNTFSRHQNAVSAFQYSFAGACNQMAPDSLQNECFPMLFVFLGKKPPIFFLPFKKEGPRESPLFPRVFPPKENPQGPPPGAPGRAPFYPFLLKIGGGKKPCVCPPPPFLPGREPDIFFPPHKRGC
jgi:hypothetical protein